MAWVYWLGVTETRTWMCSADRDSTLVPGLYDTMPVHMLAWMPCVDVWAAATEPRVHVFVARFQPSLITGVQGKAQFVRCSIQEKDDVPSLVDRGWWIGRLRPEAKGLSFLARRAGIGIVTDPHLRLISSTIPPHPTIAGHAHYQPRAAVAPLPSMPHNIHPCHFFMSLLLIHIGELAPNIPPPTISSIPTLGANYAPLAPTTTVPWWKQTIEIKIEK